MRNIEEIIKELRDHPDSMYLIHWSKEDIQEGLFDRLYEYADETEDHNMVMMLENTEEIDLAEDEWSYFKKRIIEHYNHLYELGSNYLSWDSDEPVPSVGNMDQKLKKRILRQLKLKTLLEDGEK